MDGKKEDSLSLPVRGRPREYSLTQGKTWMAALKNPHLHFLGKASQCNDNGDFIVLEEAERKGEFVRFRRDDLIGDSVSKESDQNNALKEALSGNGLLGVEFDKNTTSFRLYLKLHERKKTTIDYTASDSSHTLNIEEKSHMENREHAAKVTLNEEPISFQPGSMFKGYIQNAVIDLEKKSFSLTHIDMNGNRRRYSHLYSNSEEVLKYGRQNLEDFQAFKAVSAENAERLPISTDSQKLNEDDASLHASAPMYAPVTYLLDKGAGYYALSPPTNEMVNLSTREIVSWDNSSLKAFWAAHFRLRPDEGVTVSRSEGRASSPGKDPREGRTSSPPFSGKPGRSGNGRG